MKYFSLFTALACCFIFFSCNQTGSQDNKFFQLEFVDSIKTEVVEPSGLALSYDKKALWTVSDELNEAYLISFEGKILQSIPIDGIDPEGITIIDDTTLAVVLERDRTLIKLSTSGKELFRKTFNEFTGGLNEGFEGITYNPKNNHFFIVTEMNPRLLIELDADLNVVMTSEIKFAEDLSGLFYDESLDCLWIISHESKLIARCDLNGNLIESFKVNIPQLEGIAVDSESSKVYTICDVSGKLFIYTIIKKQ